MVTVAQPEITPDGILLTKGSVSKMLSVSGGKVSYMVWSSNIEDYADVLRVEGKPIESPLNKNTYICGYEIDIPAGEEYTLLTTIK
jgi:hypothetical protein